ncbi:MAG: hypothetical protein ACOYL6_10965 [Bacteriovoracaceae bacterium]
MRIWTLLIFLFSEFAWAENPSLCQYFDIPSCSGVTKQKRRSSSQSLPSPATATNLNPANVSFDRGLGVEAVYQQNNPVGFSLASGTGKMGGALISSTLENSFFGNRVVEIDDVLYQREIHNYRYRTEKLNLAFGRKIIDGKIFGIDLGISIKRNPDIKEVNFGTGFSGRFGPFTFGASVYHDDVYIKLENYANPQNNQLYRTFYNADTYQERFKVESYTAGVKVKNFNFDTGMIKTKYKFYDDNTRVFLYSAAANYRNFLFNAALRKEFSPRQAYSNEGVMVTKRKKTDNYYGIQYSVNKNIILGLNYNFYLLQEFSFTTSIFF